jgi:SOS-response transcriptional repressor LexA
MSARSRTGRGWQRVRVSGPSMVPTLRNGDLLIVRLGTAVRVGDVVLAHYRSMPALFVVKRATRVIDGGWWLSSDNSFARGDSGTHGVADVHGRAILRIPRGSLLPRRIR